QGFDLRGGGDQAELVPQPLHQGTGDRDGAFQSVHGCLVTDLVAERGEEAVLGGDGFGTGVHDQESPGAVSALEITGIETGLTEQGCVLVAECRSHGHATEGTAALTVDLGGGTDLGQDRGGDVHRVQDAVISVQGRQVHQHGAARVAHVGDVAPGQFPDAPGVHGAEQDFTAFCALAQAVDVVQEPADLGPGEIGGQRQTTHGTEAILALVPTEFAYQLVGPGVLPDDGVVAGPSGLLVPDDGGLTLVGDADRGDLFGGDVTFAKRLLDDGLDVGPDLLGVVFDPPRAGKYLLVFALVHRDDASVPVEEDAAARRGALVDRGDVLLTHRCSPSAGTTVWERARAENCNRTLHGIAVRIGVSFMSPHFPCQDLLRQRF